MIENYKNNNTRCIACNSILTDDEVTMGDAMCFDCIVQCELSA